MSSAPAGWYRDASAPGGRRYWNGAAWLDPAPLASVPPLEFSPEANTYMPSTVMQQAAEFRPPPMEQYPAAPLGTAPALHHVPVAHPTNAREEDVSWDVVGVPREPQPPAMDASPHPGWSPSTGDQYAAAPTAGQRSGPGSFVSTAYVAPMPLDYSSLPSDKGRWSGQAKVAVSIAGVVLAFGIRWAFSLFFGGDFSSDGRIDVTAPATWTTYTISNPDLTYAMDPNWQDARDLSSFQNMAADVYLVDARALSTDFSGNQALIAIVSTSAPLPGAKAPRDVFTSGFDASLAAMQASGADLVSRDKITILKSRAGDRWGFSTAKLSLQGTGVTVYEAVAIVDDYVVAIELIVPNGGGLTRNDILAVVNSVEER